MPTYIYQCKSCSYQFEEFQKISDDLIRICPSCNKKSVVRIISGGAGLLFKGSGFYQTDYKKTDGDGKEKKPEKKTKAAAGEKQESKTPSEQKTSSGSSESTSSKSEKKSEQ